MSATDTKLATFIKQVLQLHEKEMRAEMQKSPMWMRSVAFRNYRAALVKFCKQEYRERLEVQCCEGFFRIRRFRKLNFVETDALDQLLERVSFDLEEPLERAGSRLHFIEEMTDLVLSHCREMQAFHDSVNRERFKRYFRCLYCVRNQQQDTPHEEFPLIAESTTENESDKNGSTSPIRQKPTNQLQKEEVKLIPMSFEFDGVSQHIFSYQPDPYTYTTSDATASDTDYSDSDLQINIADITTHHTDSETKASDTNSSDPMADKLVLQAVWT